MSNKSSSSVIAQHAKWLDKVLIGVDDFLILVVGPTGTGKSSFINRVIGEDVMAVGHRLTSCTTEVAWGSLQLSGYRVILVDTPGIDDTFETNVGTVQTILQWFEKWCPKDVHFGGIIYFQNIANPRFSTLPQAELEMLDASFKDAKEFIMPRITLVTSMWNKVDEEDGTKREQELKNEQWNTLLQQGANLHRFDNSKEKAQKILETAIGQGHRRVPNLQKYIQDFQIRQNALQERKENMLVRIGQKMKNLRNKTEQKGKPDLLLGNPPTIDITRSDTRTTAFGNNDNHTLSNPVIDHTATSQTAVDKSKRGIPFIGKKRQKAAPAPPIASTIVSNGQGSRSSNTIKPEDQSSVSNSVRTTENHIPATAAPGPSGIPDTLRQSSDDLRTLYDAAMHAIDKGALDAADLDRASSDVQKAAVGTTHQPNQDRPQESIQSSGVESGGNGVDVPKKKSSKDVLPKEVNKFERSGEDIRPCSGERKVDDEAPFRHSNAASNCESRLNTIPFVSTEKHSLNPSLKSSHSTSSDDTSFSSAKSKINLTTDQDNPSPTERATRQETNVERSIADKARDNVEGDPSERHERAEPPTQQKDTLVQGELERGPDPVASAGLTYIEGKEKQQQDPEVTEVLRVLAENPTACNVKNDSKEVVSPGALEAPTPKLVNPTAGSPIQNLSSAPGQAESTPIQARNTPEHFNDELPASGSDPVTTPVQLTSLHGDSQRAVAKADLGTVVASNLQKSEPPSETRDRDAEPKDDVQNNHEHSANSMAKPICASAVVTRTDHIPEAQTNERQSNHQQNNENDTKNVRKHLDGIPATFLRTISRITESRMESRLRQKVDTEKYLMALRPSASL